MAKKTGIEWDIPTPVHAGHTIEVYAPEKDDAMNGAYRLVCSCGEAVWFLGALHTMELGSFSPYTKGDEEGRTTRVRVGSDFSGNSADAA